MIKIRYITIYNNYHEGKLTHKCRPSLMHSRINNNNEPLALSWVVC